MQAFDVPVRVCLHVLYFPIEKYFDERKLGARGKASGSVVCVWLLYGLHVIQWINVIYLTMQGFIDLWEHPESGSGRGGGGVQETLLVAVKLSSHLLFTWMQLLFTCLFVFFSSYSSTFVMRYHFSVSNSSPKTFKVVSVCSDWWVGKPSSHEKREPKKLNKQQQIAPPFKVFVRKLRSISPPSR